MAIEKNITMKQFNGTDYDTLYPKTIASQIPDVYSKSYIDSILKDNARIQTGSYVGTGTYGKDNPCTLTFDFVPKLVIIYNSQRYNSPYPIITYGIFVNATPFSTINYVVLISDAVDYNNYNINGKTFSIYSENEAIKQFNLKGMNYIWVGIG